MTIRWSQVIGLIVFLFPLSISRVDFRSTFFGGLSVSLNKSSPAYAALEDSRTSFEAEDEENNFPAEGLTLAAGVRAAPELRLPRARLVVMHGLTINHPADEVRGLPMVAASEIKSKSELTPMAERKKILLAQMLEQEDWQAPSPSQQALNLADHSSKREQERVIISATGTSIIVRKPQAANSQGPVPTRIHEPDPTEDPAVAAPSWRQVSTNKEGLRPLWLTGHLEMTGGLAYTGRDQSLTLRRVVNGQVAEQGRVWITEGKFEIYVKGAIGQLVAELNEHGRTLGRGEMNLVDLQEISSSDQQISDIRLALRPTAEGAEIAAVSAYSTRRHKIPVASAKVELQSQYESERVNREGVYSNPSLIDKSTYLTRVSANGYWSTLFVAQAGVQQEVRLYPNQMVDALIALNLQKSDRLEAEDLGLVWGQVVRDGAPIGGARVELAGQYQPIYFNEAFLPDEARTTTSSNGMFAFLRVKPGVQALRVISGGRLFPAQIFTAEEHHVSQVDVDLGQRNVIDLTVTDTLDFTRPISAKVRVLGSEGDGFTASHQAMEFVSGASPTVLEVDPGEDFLVTRVAFPRGAREVQIPALRKTWLEETLQNANAQAFAGQNIIVGFVGLKEYEVDLTGYADSRQKQIIYFPETEKSPGGFVILNAPSGMQTLSIYPAQSAHVYSQVVAPDPNHVFTVMWLPD